MPRRSCAKWRTDGRLLIGVDRKKDIGVPTRAPDPAHSPKGNCSAPLESSLQPDKPLARYAALPRQ